MNTHERVPIVRKEGIAIYGRVIDAKGKLGRYEVISDFESDTNIYHQFADAERAMDRQLDTQAKRLLNKQR